MAEASPCGCGRRQISPGPEGTGIRQTHDVGIEGLALSPGHHICALYDTDAARDEVLVPYLRAGLAAGHRCVAALDGFDQSAVAEALGGGPEVAA